MSNKFHVNPATGDVLPCHATKNPCLYGGGEVHGETREEAQAKYEAKMAKGSERKLSKSKTPRTRKNGFTPTSNPEQAEAMRQLGSSSATSAQDNRPNRQRTRKDSKRAAIRDQY